MKHVDPVRSTGQSSRTAAAREARAREAASVDDHRANASAQRALSQAIDRSPQHEAQRALGEVLHSATAAVAQRVPTPAERAQRDRGGLPEELRSGVESLSGMNLDDVRVHYNSSSPGAVDAHAYAQGRDIHVAPGQEAHLAHEAWHVVQQAQGRVRPTMQLNGSVPINDDVRLEREADAMGQAALGRAAQRKRASQEGAHDQGCGCASCGGATTPAQGTTTGSPVQAKVRQLRSCKVCGHKESDHKKGRCKICGCMSHSSKHDSGGKFNPGAGKRERMLESHVSGGSGGSGTTKK